jgi:hypothetical protein
MFGWFKDRTDAILEGLREPLWVAVIRDPHRRTPCAADGANSAPKKSSSKKAVKRVKSRRR